MHKSNPPVLPPKKKKSPNYSGGYVDCISGFFDIVTVSEILLCREKPILGAAWQEKVGELWQTIPLPQTGQVLLLYVQNDGAKTSQVFPQKITEFGEFCHFHNEELPSGEQLPCGCRFSTTSDILAMLPSNQSGCLWILR